MFLNDFQVILFTQNRISGERKYAIYKKAQPH